MTHFLTFKDHIVYNIFFNHLRVSNCICLQLKTISRMLMEYFSFSYSNWNKNKNCFKMNQYWTRLKSDRKIKIIQLKASSYTLIYPYNCFDWK